jgi:hypothetical protein
VEWLVYVVESRDTISHIAEWAETTIQALVTANCLDDSDLVFTGQLLYVPRVLHQISTVPAQSSAADPGWNTYTDPPYQVTFEYPDTWQDVSHGMMTRLMGDDGFVQLAALGAPYDLDVVTSNQAYHRLRPYGLSPIIEAIRLNDGRDARLIFPSEGQLDRLQGQAALITQYGEPIELGNYRHNYLVLTADVEHIRRFANTIQLPPPPNYTGIDFFEVDAEELPSGGKRLTFTWDSHGATRGMIVSGTAMRFSSWWPVESFGDLTVDLSGTIYPDPNMTLIVFNDITGKEDRASAGISWPCEHEYFFSPSPRQCPRQAVLEETGAFQPFERGFMIWLPRPDLENPSIYAFNGAGEVFIYPDTWTDVEQESEPTLNPPSGLVQPVRGFGKVWRELVWLQDELGWATAGESAFQLKFQVETRESIPGVSYLTLPDGRLVQIMNFQWSYYNPVWVQEIRLDRPYEWNSLFIASNLQRNHPGDDPSDSLQ